MINYLIYIIYFLGFHISKNWPNKGEIIFENVSLRYASQNQPVISNFSLKIPAGQKVRIHKKKKKK